MIIICQEYVGEEQKFDLFWLIAILPQRIEKLAIRLPFPCVHKHFFDPF